MSAAQAVQGALAAPEVDVNKLTELISKLANAIYSHTAQRRLNTVIETYRPIRMVVDTKVDREDAWLTLTVTVYVYDLSDGKLYRAGHVKVETKHMDFEGALSEVAKRVKEAYASKDDVGFAVIELCSRYYLHDLVELFVNAKAIMIELSKMIEGNVDLWADMCVSKKDVMVHAHAVYQDVVNADVDSVVDFYVVSNGM